ncbi:extensin family protein [uncultured Roseibium sp.]|uniref:extensin-like domain-containing protein n=1 Tax=uncultured Roseibium sp. TaxID=1936171 RepID=UPI003216A900
MDFMGRGGRRIAAAFLAAATVCLSDAGYGFVVPSVTPVPEKRPERQSGAVPVPVPKPDLSVSENTAPPQAEAAEEMPDAAPVPCTQQFADVVDLPAIVGENGCGFSSAVRLAGVNGTANVKFVPEPMVNCRFAGALSKWIAEDLAQIAMATKGERLKAVHAGPGYQCRRRNNLEDGKLSEHAVGNALDILGFEFVSGDVVSVENDWSGEGADTEPRRKFLHAVHDTACKRFTTVLGPGADDYHEGHIHVDIGCHGKTCTYRICQ